MQKVAEGSAVWVQVEVGLSFWNGKGRGDTK